MRVEIERTSFANDRARWFLLASVAITTALYVVPFGHTIGYPLVLISTVVHEMGHGVAAILVGGSCKALMIYSGGGGIAPNTHPAGPFANGFVSAGGLCGPAVLAALFFLLGTRPRTAVVTLGVAGAVVLGVDAVLVRTLFGIVFMAALGAVAIGVAWKASARTSQLVLLFVAVQLALSVFSRGDYLFMEEATTPAGTFPSDVARMASALGGPYWFWGLVCGGFSVVSLIVGVWIFFRATRSAVPASAA